MPALNARADQICRDHQERVAGRIFYQALSSPTDGMNTAEWSSSIGGDKPVDMRAILKIPVKLATCSVIAVRGRTRMGGLLETVKYGLSIQ